MRPGGAAAAAESGSFAPSGEHHTPPDGRRPPGDGRRAAANGRRAAGNGHVAPEAGALPASGDAGDPGHFRSVLGRFATGVVAVTGIDPADGAPHGLAVNSFTSVSLDPPLVAFCVANTSMTWQRLKAAPSICVNVLSERQEHVSRRLAAKGVDKFAGLPWSPSPGGGPFISGALAWIDCSIESEHVAGDHTIVVARVLALDAHADHGPLLFFRGDYGRFGV
ncbi:flavin reductase family protein [Sphaerisporangium dianthi]|uniref:Flavin reductase family protein n=1 Tax=Sphaerisporangium dianthi TaxID=1436120 RepID=A0ABV9C9G7_9ACTN